MPTSPMNIKSRPKLKESCDHCARAKVKCNREQPTCSRCQDRDLLCGYSFSRRAGRRPGRVDQADSITQPTSPTGSTSWSSATTTPAPSLTPDLPLTTQSSIESYSGSAVASPTFMSPYMMSASMGEHPFGGYLDEYNSFSTSPASTGLESGSIPIEQLSITSSASSFPSISSGASCLHSRHSSLSSYPGHGHLMTATSGSIDPESFRTDMPGFPMPSMPSITANASSDYLVNPILMDGVQAWVSDEFRHLSSTLPQQSTCRFASSGQTCMTQLTKVLQVQAAKVSSQHTVADLLAANRQILAVAVMTLACPCATKESQLLELLSYAAGNILARYELGASGGAAIQNLLADMPYLERYLSILAETISKSRVSAWSRPSLDLGSGEVPSRPIMPPLAEVRSRTMGLRRALERSLAAA